MTLTSILRITTTAFVLTPGVCPPAFAQESAPAPNMATEPPPVMAPLLLPAPSNPTPAGPAVALKAANDMTGAVGFGVGVLPGDSLIKPDTSVLVVKYWRSDSLAIAPRFKLSLHKEKDQDTAWSLEPSALASYTLFKGASTRLSAGAGLGLALAKKKDPATSVNANTHVGLFVPAEIGVEHFFTRWFSMGVSATFDFLNFSRQGDHWSFDLQASNTEYQGSIFIYTD